MKKRIFLILILNALNYLYAQENLNLFDISTNQFNYETQSIANNSSSTPNSLSFNCNENFWTINLSGEIQQWSLNNGVISGGEIILNNGNQAGLSIAGTGNNLTFYSPNYTNQTISYYNDTTNNWLSIDVSDNVLNNGAFDNHQYYTGTVFDSDLNFDVSRVLYYFDGTSLITLESFASDFITVADIAVDGQGRAWVFKGNSLHGTNSLNVYDETGLLFSYSIEFDSYASYGSFFLNDTLYIGISNGVNPTYTNVIAPIILNGQNAELGTPISFSYNQYSDFASCQNANPLSITEFNHQKTKLILSPNPTNGILKLSSQTDIESVEIRSINGKLLKTILNNDDIDLRNYSSGIYYLRIKTKTNETIKKVIKL